MTITLECPPEMVVFIQRWRDLMIARGMIDPRGLDMSLPVDAADIRNYIIGTMTDTIDGLREFDVSDALLRANGIVLDKSNRRARELANPRRPQG